MRRGVPCPGLSAGSVGSHKKSGYGEKMGGVPDQVAECLRGEHV